MHALNLSSRPVTKFHRVLNAAALCAVMAFACSSPAQLSVGPTGLPVQTFDVLPPAHQWSTRGVLPNSASAITTAAQLDAVVQTNDAILITDALAANALVPPVLAADARWNSTSLFLQTRANGVVATLLKATLRNDSGQDLPSIVIRYDAGALVAAGSSISESIPGHRVYYSFTGAPGTWIHVPELDSASASEEGVKTAFLSFGTNWINGALLYLIFADDNGPSSSSPPNHEGGYTIDNFLVSLPRVTILNQPQGQFIPPGTTAAFSVTALGAEPLSYQWRKDGQDIEGATNENFIIEAVSVGDAGVYSVVVSNEINFVVSSNALLQVGFDPVAITTQPTNARVALGAQASFTVVASGTVPHYQWFRNGAAVPQATNATYAIAAAAEADAGFYFAIVSNPSNMITSSQVSLHISQQVSLLPVTNQWRFDNTGANHGTNWRGADFDDSAWPQGSAVFGFPVNADVKTPLSRTNDGGAFIITDYFRTHFTVTNDLVGALLIASNLVDDGAVYYLNGHEVGRRAMPPGLIAANTRASSFDGGLAQGAYGLDLFPTEGVRNGDNLLSVEVHQLTSNSSDVYFGLALLLHLPDLGPAAIRQQPRSQSAIEGVRVKLETTVAGTQPLGLQWFRNGEPIPGATNHFLVFPGISLNERGWYQIQVSNAFGSVLSTNVELHVVSPKAPSLTVVSFTNEWRYEATGTDLGSAWRSNSYSVTSWQAGRGIFSNLERDYPETMNTLLPVPNPVGAINTVYFRTRFDAPGNTTNTTFDLVFSNLLDDGAVFYLNGAELFRTRIGNGSVSYETLAASSPTHGEAHEFVITPRVTLQATDNVLAVEVHQSASTSSDVVFGSRLHILANDDDPAQIVTEPKDVTVPIGYPATLSSETFGAPPLHWQWFKDGVAVPGATNEVLHFDVTALEDDAGYRLEVSNHINVVTSRVARLTIGAATNTFTAITRGPYLQNGTTNSIVIRWRTDVPAASRVVYGTNPAALDLSAEQPVMRTEHILPLTDLRPDTRYYYVVATAFSNLVAGEEFSFLTPPMEGKPTRIWVQGDQGTASPEARSVVNAFTNFHGSVSPDVWLLLGDNAYYEGTDEEYQQALFDFMPDVLRSSLLWTTIGNHETYSDDGTGRFPYLDIFSPPTQGEGGGVPSGTKHYYSFDYGNIHFVCLDSEVSDRSTNGAMAAWLREDLALNDKDWLIAFWHSPPYTHGSHNSDDIFDSGGRLVDMRENFLPILEAHGVDLVLSGHSHCYERSRLLDGHYGYSASLDPFMVKDGGDGREGGTGAYRKSSVGPAPNEGAVYVVAGSSGWATFGTLDHPVMEVSLLEMGSLVIDVSSNRLDARFLRETGAIDDRFTIVKGASSESFRVANFRVTGNQVHGAWKSVAGEWYQVVASDDVAIEGWSAITEPVQATGATMFWTNIVDGERLFYRVRQVPAPAP
jgi:hypothetical protein